jgi:carboxymethylenebutenolidase
MCDETTEIEHRIWLAAQSLGRRDMGRFGAAAAAAAMMPGALLAAGSQGVSKAAAKGRSVSIKTPDGTADAWFVHPDEGKHPAIILWPDIAGLRDAYKVMAERLAGSGYAVLVVNQYYRSARAPVLNSLSDWFAKEGQAKLKPMIAAITPTGTARDGAAFVDWLDAQPQVDTARKIGSTGYCMGGPFTFRTAAARPDRVGAIGSFHGAGLVTDKSDSPHLLIPKMEAGLLICIAKNDDAGDPKAKTVLRASAEAAKRPAEIEVYAAQHGWCTIDAPVYDKALADKAWVRMLDTFRKYL